VKPESEWYVSPNLKRLYKERIKAKGISQAQFAEVSGIGSQTLISMLLNRDRSITPQNAVKFCEMLQCTMHEVCPEMAEFMAKELLPHLGKALRRAAMLAGMSIGALLFGAFDNNGFVATNRENSSAKTTYYTMRDKINRFLRWLLFQNLTSISRS